MNTNGHESGGWLRRQDCRFYSCACVFIRGSKESKLAVALCLLLSLTACDKPATETSLHATHAEAAAAPAVAKNDPWCGPATNSSHTVHALPATSFVAEMDVGMQKMMADMHAPGYTGNPDVDFLAMMIPHHQGAIDMARLELIHGKDPLTRNLAEEIIASQQVEINAMKARLALIQQKGGATNQGEFPTLGGTRGTAEPTVSK